SVRRGAVAVAEHPGDGPVAVLQPPDHGEPGFAFAGAAAGAAEAMPSLRDRPEAGHRMDLQAAGHQLSRVAAAGVATGVVQHRLAGPGDAAGVVVELDGR